MLDDGHRRLAAIERRLSYLEMNPAPTVPQYDLAGFAPEQRYLALTWRHKSYPHWWGLDDTYADNTTLPRWFDGWSARDIGYVCKLSADGTTYTFVAGDVNGFWTPSNHPPGYVGPSVTPLGVVGNGFTNFQTNNLTGSVNIFNGDTLSWIAGHQNTDPTDVWSIPGVKVTAQIVDQFDNSIVVHDFGDFTLDTNAHDVTSVLDFPNIPAGAVSVGPTWVVS